MPQNLYTSPIESLRFEDVVAYCNEQNPEGVRLDYKREFSSSKDARGAQIAKLVSAMANTSGGIIIYGVDEPNKDRRPEMNPAGRDLSTDPRQTVQSACYHNIYPPVTPEVSDFLANPENSKAGFLIVRIAASEIMPHTVEDLTRVYIRVNDQAEPAPATVHQIERMITERNTRLSRQEQRVEKGIQQLLRALSHGGKSATHDGRLIVAIGPSIADKPLLDRQSLADFKPDGHDPASSTVDSGAFSVDYMSRKGWLADVFGNLILIDADPSLCRTYPVRYGLHHAEWVNARAMEDGFPSVQFTELFNTIHIALASVSDRTKKVGYYGNWVLRVRVLGCFVKGLLVNEDYAIAANRTDEILEGHIRLSPEDFGDHCWTGMIRSIDWLIHAWGSLETAPPDEYANLFEKTIFGADSCPTSSSHPARPRHRPLCLVCRKQGQAHRQDVDRVGKTMAL